MKLSDALNILGITGDYTPESVKQAYRKACSIYHPDRNPAGLEMMKMVNQAYEALKEESGQAQAAGEASDYGSEISESLSKIIHLGLDIEVCGSWVWLHGDTKPHKELLKEAGFMWAPKKALWYYRPADYKSKARGNFSMDDIRLRHGREKVTLRERSKLKAA